MACTEVTDSPGATGPEEVELLKISIIGPTVAGGTVVAVELIT